MKSLHIASYKYFYDSVIAMKKPECKDIIKVVLPAVRASVAETMREKYRYSQEEIAQKLGVVQVAVSKYLHKRYSAEISKMKAYVTEHGLTEGIVSEIVKGGSRQEVDAEIDRLCDRLVAVDVA